MNKVDQTTIDEASVRLADGKLYTFSELAAEITIISERGEWYDGEGSTHISEWLAEGDYTGDETIKSLAAEWDR